MTTTPDEQQTLLEATHQLIDEVRTLSGAVQTNNKKIDRLQHEVNCKPDDVEVQVVAGIAHSERARAKVVFIAAVIVSSLIASILAGGISYRVATVDGRERCEGNSENINTIINFLDTIKSPSPELQQTIKELKTNRNEC